MYLYEWRYKALYSTNGIGTLAWNDKKGGLPLGIPQMSGLSGSQKDREQEDCVFYSYMQTRMKLVQSMYQ